MFHKPGVFHFTNTLTKNWEVIRDEYLALPNNIFDPWVQHEMYEGDWSVFGLLALGKHLCSARQLCPQTARILEEIPAYALDYAQKLLKRSKSMSEVGQKI